MTTVLFVAKGGGVSSSPQSGGLMVTQEGIGNDAVVTVAEVGIVLPGGLFEILSSEVVA